MGRLEGKVAFITGASRGQGRAHAVRLAEEGADIIAIDVAGPIEGVDYPLGTQEELDETARLVEALDRRIVTAKADVRDLAKMKEVVDQGVAELGRLDIIAANAGIDLVMPWDGATEENVQTTIEVNLIGVWKTVMAGVQHMIDSGGGSIILTSSANGLRAFPFNVPYTMAKFGVTGLAKALAMELAKHNIRVNSVHPGGVNTPLVETAWPQFEALKEGNEALFAALEVAAFKPGMMDPREISNAILWLASDESTWVTGHALTVDGGATQH